MGELEALSAARHASAKEDPSMNNDNVTAWEDRPTEDTPQIANMDEIDFMTLLMECRIIQAS